MLRSGVVLLVAAILVALFAGDAGTTTTGSWQTVLDDNFSTMSSLPSHWYKRSTADPNQAGVYFAPQHCYLSGGYLNLKMSYEPNGLNGFPAGWYFCNIRTQNVSTQADQRVTVVWRYVATNGGSAHYVMPISWPTSNCSGDGEEDWFEGQGGTAHSFMHYSIGTCTSGQTNSYITLDWPKPDLSNFHTYTVQRITTGTSVAAKAFLDGVRVYSCNATTTPACNTTDMPATQNTTGLQEDPPVNAPEDTNGGHDGTVIFQVKSVKIDNWVP